MQEFISTSEEIFTQHDVDNKELKEENKQLQEENQQLRKENEQLRKNNANKDAAIKKSIEIKSPKEDKNTTYNYPNWFDRNSLKTF